MDKKPILFISHIHEERELAIAFKDLVENVNFGEILPQISDKKDKAFLIHQMRVISHLDTIYSSEEKRHLK